MLDNMLSGRPSLREFGDQLPVLALGILKAVKGSLRKHEMRTLTTREVEDRIRFCTEMAMELRHSMHWGVQRIADCLPEILDCHLQGRVYEPSKRSMWVPTDGL